MKYLSFVFVSVFIFVLGCDSENVGSQRDKSCDDGTIPACRMVAPECEEGAILAYQNSCYQCVDPNTCEPPLTNNQNNQNLCSTDADCSVTQYCNPCGTASCPGCTDCVPACSPHQCETQTDVLCNTVRPDCGEGKTSIVQDGCWACVELFSCQPVRNPSCDDGSELTCNTLVAPECEAHEILSVQNGCYLCVNPQTCQPWGTPGCYDDSACLSSEYCNSCGSSSCPFCEDCIPACTPHNCQTQDEPECNLLRPDCGDGSVSIIVDGCWQCVDNATCESVRDAHCDDGTEPICTQVPPDCSEHEILAYQNNCYECVNPITCKIWGEPGCESDIQCGNSGYCDPCATSSGPYEDDCISGCLAHNCPSESEALCNMAQPECGETGVAIVENGCYVCVDINTCEPIE